MTEELRRLSRDVRMLAEEIALMKAAEQNMEPGPKRKNLKRVIRQKQYQALFYVEKIETCQERGKKIKKGAVNLLIIK